MNNFEIAYLCTSQSRGGLEINVVRLATWLYERNRNVILLCVENSFIHKLAFQNNIPVRCVKRHVRYVPLFHALLLYRELRKLHAEILFLSDKRDIGLAVIAKKYSWGRLKVIYQQQMQIGVSKKDIFHTLRYALLDAWTAPLKWLADQVRRKTRINPDKIRIIPLCVDTEELLNHTYKKGEARAMLGINPHSPLLGIIGRIEKEKGQHFLIEAVGKLNADGYPCELLIMGDTTAYTSHAYMDSLEQMIQEHHLREKIHIRPFNTDIALFYNAIDIFILASKNETYGMVTVEAMTFGLPVIATNSAGTTELVDDEKTGLLYTPFSIDEFCHCVTKLLTDKNKCSGLGEKAGKSAVERFDKKIECEQIEELIMHLNVGRIK